MPDQDQDQVVQQMVEVKAGLKDPVYVPVGTTVAKVRKGYGQDLGLVPGQSAMLVDGRAVDENYVLQPGDKLRFVRSQDIHA